MDTNRGRTIAA